MTIIGECVFDEVEKKQKNLRNGNYTLSLYVILVYGAEYVFTMSTYNNYIVEILIVLCFCSQMFLLCFSYLYVYT